MPSKPGTTTDMPADHTFGFWPLMYRSDREKDLTLSLERACHGGNAAKAGFCPSPSSSPVAPSFAGAESPALFSVLLSLAPGSTPLLLLLELSELKGECIGNGEVWCQDEIETEDSFEQDLAIRVMANCGIFARSCTNTNRFQVFAHCIVL